MMRIMKKLFISLAPCKRVRNNEANLKQIHV